MTFSWVNQIIHIHKHNPLTLNLIFTMKQADFMSTFVGVRSEKHPKNINKISSDIDKRFGNSEKDE